MLLLKLCSIFKNNDTIKGGLVPAQLQIKLTMCGERRKTSLIPYDITLRICFVSAQISFTTLSLLLFIGLRPIRGMAFNESPCYIAVLGFRIDRYFKGWIDSSGIALMMVQ